MAQGAGQSGGQSSGNRTGGQGSQSRTGGGQGMGQKSGFSRPSNNQGIGQWQGLPSGMLDALKALAFSAPLGMAMPGAAIPSPVVDFLKRTMLGKYTTTPMNIGERMQTWGSSKVGTSGWGKNR